MPSLKLSVAVVATAIFSMNTYAQYVIDPSSVSLSTRRMLPSKSLKDVAFVDILQKVGANHKYPLAHYYVSKTLDQLIPLPQLMTVML